MHTRDPRLVLYLGAFPGRKYTAIKECPHQRAEQYGHSGKTAEVLLKPRSGEDSFLCYPAKVAVCVTFHRKNWERNERVAAQACRISKTHSGVSSSQTKHSSETVQDGMLHAQLHPQSKVSCRGHIYYFRKESTNIDSHIHHREQSLQVRANRLVCWCDLSWRNIFNSTAELGSPSSLEQSFHWINFTVALGAFVSITRSCWFSWWPLRSIKQYFPITANSLFHDALLIKW